MIAALGILIRTSVLLACVSVFSLALRRASASVRHALWVVALLAVLAFHACLQNAAAMGLGRAAGEHYSCNRIRHDTASGSESRACYAACSSRR